MSVIVSKRFLFNYIYVLHKYLTHKQNSQVYSCSVILETFSPVAQLTFLHTQMANFIQSCCAPASCFATHLLRKEFLLLSPLALRVCSLCLMLSTIKQIRGNKIKHRPYHQSSPSFSSFCCWSEFTASR